MWDSRCSDLERGWKEEEGGGVEGGGGGGEEVGEQRRLY